MEPDNRENDQKDQDRISVFDLPSNPYIARLAVWAFRIRHILGTKVGQTLASIRRGEHAFVIIVAIIIGILGGYGAIIFRELILISHHTFFMFSDGATDQFAQIPWWKRLIMPTIGGILVGIIVSRFAPAVKGSGIPEVMESVARKGGLIQFRIILAKAVAAALTLGSGGSAGREGPIVHIGSAIGSAVGQFLKVPARRLRTFVACGAAAGIAATFNAPIAGALFAVEVVLADLAVASLSPIVISSVVATVISRHYLGDFPALRVPPFQFQSSQELLLYAVLGLAAGLLSVAFIKMLFGIGSWFERSSLPQWLRPGIGGLGVGLLALGLPHIHGVGYASIDSALQGTAVVELCVILIIAKMLATSLTLGSGGSGGVFAPSLFLGALLGAALGFLFNWLFPGSTAPPGAYALVGMGAVVAGTTHAPITAILMMFEMTNDYRIIPPLMISCVLAILLSGWLHKNSIYTEKLARRGVKLFEGRDINLLRSILVKEVMEMDAPMVHADMSFSELVPKLLSTRHPELLVVDEHGTYLGVVALDDIKSVLPESNDLYSLAVAADAVNESVPFVLPDDNLDLVMHIFGRIHRDELPVCADSSSKKVLGVISRDAVIDSYNKRVFQMDMSGGFSSLIAAVKGGRTVEVVGDLHLGEIETPSALFGKTLAEAEIRRHFDLEVIMIQTAHIDESCIEGRPGKVPKADVKLEPGDRLLVMGTKEAIAKIQNWEGPLPNEPKSRLSIIP